MKFLLFNAVVAAAIGYLLLGGNSNQPADLMAKVAATVSGPVDEDSQIMADALAPSDPVKAAPVKASKPTPEFIAPPARRAPAPAGQNVTAEALPKTPAEPQKTEVAAVQPKAEKPADPGAVKRRAQVTGEDAAGDDSDEEPTFMSPAERRRELMRLAEDMELRFLDTVSR